jgi:hypothetical protein
MGDNSSGNGFQVGHVDYQSGSRTATSQNNEVAMRKNVIMAGLLGFLVFVAWFFVVNGLLRFSANIEMKSIPEERFVYETLKEHVVEPGRYVMNPEVTPERQFPGDEPVFSVLYSGMGHESAGMFMLIGLVVFLLAPTIAAWLLSQASDRVLASYPRKVLFFTMIGLLIALFSDVDKFNIGDYPLADMALLAGHTIVVWTVVGLVMASRLKPRHRVTTAN